VSITVDTHYGSIRASEPDLALALLELLAAEADLDRRGVEADLREAVTMDLV
jgi:hypothetical protein